MKVAIIGSRTWPYVAGGPALFDWLAQTFPLDTTIYTRGSKGFDTYLTEGARFMGYTVIEMKGAGGADNYLRDVKLVESVDEVHAFFDAEHLGEGGTQHVIDKALDARTPSHSYIWDRGIVLVGSDDGEGEPVAGEDPAPGPPQAAREDPPQPAEPGGSAPADWRREFDDLGF